MDIKSVDLKQLYCQLCLRISTELLFQVWNHDKPFVSSQQKYRELLYRGEREVERARVNKEPTDFSLAEFWQHWELLPRREAEILFLPIGLCLLSQGMRTHSGPPTLFNWRFCLLTFSPPIHDYLWYVKVQHYAFTFHWHLVWKITPKTQCWFLWISILGNS